MSEQNIEVPEYNDDYSLKYRIHTVNTKYSTCMALRPLFKIIGLQNLLKSGDVERKDLILGVVNALSEANLINEFCQIVTGKKDVNFNDCEFGEICWIVNDFFTAYWWQMPPSWRAGLKKAIGMLQELGKEFLQVTSE